MGSLHVVFEDLHGVHKCALSKLDVALLGCNNGLCDGLIGFLKGINQRAWNCIFFFLCHFLAPYSFIAFENVTTQWSSVCAHPVAYRHVRDMAKSGSCDLSVHSLIPGETVGADVSAVVLIREFPERTTKQAAPTAIQSNLTKKSSLYAHVRSPRSPRGSDYHLLVQAPSYGLV